MAKAFKVIIAGLILIALILIGRHYYERGMLRDEYEIALVQQEKEDINSFYKSDLKGVITYIKQYDKNPDQYVIGITDSAKNETTIGKVEITNFSNVMEGDTINKKSNSFELEIIGKKGKVQSLIKYE